MPAYIRLRSVMLVGVLLVLGFTAVQLVSAAVSSSGITCPGNLRLNAQFDVSAVNEYRVSGSGPGLPTATYTSSDTAGENFTWMVKGPGTWSGLTLEWRRPPGVPDWDTSMYTTSLTYKCVAEADNEPGPPAMNLFDGRINNFQDRDVAAPVAIYEGSIKVYGIDPVSGDGWLDVDITKETIEAVGIPADVPALLGQGTNHYTGIGIFVYRLPTGEFQVNTHYHDGKPYIFAWDGDGGKWHFAW